MLLDADAVARWTADRLLTGSLQGAIVIALVWLASRRIPNVPASVQAALWWMAALKLLLTLLPIPALALPILPAETRLAALPADLAAAHISSGMDASVVTEAPGWLLRGAPAGSTDAESVSVWLAALVFVWFCAVGWQAMRLFMMLRTLRTIVHRSVPPIAEDRALVAQLAGVVGLTRVPEVRVSADIDAPQLAGIHRPVVLVPVDATGTLTAEERAMALCHELMHIRRHDLALGWVPALAEHLFFFHPLARLAAREYLIAREAACDAAVVRVLGVSAGDYGRLLVRVGVASPVSAFAAGGASPSKSSLRRRLEMLQYVPSSGASRRSMWCMATVMFVAMIPLQLVAAPTGQAETPAPISQAERDRVRIPAMPPSAAAIAEQQAFEEHRQALEEVRKKLAAEEAMRKSRLQDAEVRTQVEAMQRNLNEQAREAITREMLERQRRVAELLQAAQQLELRELRLRTLTQQVDRFNLERQAIALQRQLAASALAPSGPYSRDEIVALSPAADGTRPPNSRVLAVAGDRVRVARTGILVNDLAVTGLSSEFLAGLPEVPWEQTVPPGHYFVAAEQRSESHVSRFWGLIPAERIGGRP